MLRVDHVILAVRDLDQAAAGILERHGLASVAGGRHPGWGTGNRIVPLGLNYIELLGVVDAEEASRAAFGRAVLATVAEGERFFGWCVATDDLEGVAARLGLDIQSGSRARTDGTALRWRSVGMDLAIEERTVPFFISWSIPAEDHPGRDRAAHRARPSGIAWVEVGGDGAMLAQWLGEDGRSLPVRVAEGPAGVRAVGIATKDGEIVLP